MNLSDIERLAKVYDDARALLSDRVSDCENQMRAVKRAELPRIKGALAKAIMAKETLRAAIERHPELFIKPKTHTLHNIKCGFRKGKGELEWEDDETLVGLIEKKYKDDDDMLDQLLIVKIKPNKIGLGNLEVSELRKLGVTVEETGEQVVVKPADGAVEKLVNALLKDATEEAA